jgi:hypothetical protein
MYVVRQSIFGIEVAAVDQNTKSQSFAPGVEILQLFSLPIRFVRIEVAQDTAILPFQMLLEKDCFERTIALASIVS